MNTILISVLSGVAAFSICRALLKRPLLLFTAVGLAGYLQPTLPTGIAEQLHAAVPSVPAINTARCADDAAATCIIQENKRYADQILNLTASVNNIFDPLYEVSEVIDEATMRHR